MVDFTGESQAILHGPKTEALETDEMSLCLVTLEKTELFPNNSLNIWKKCFKGTTKAEAHLFFIFIPSDSNKDIKPNH